VYGDQIQRDSRIQHLRTVDRLGQRDYAPLYYCTAYRRGGTPLTASSVAG
jgi:hypothetical protein